MSNNGAEREFRPGHIGRFDERHTRRLPPMNGRERREFGASLGPAEAGVRQPLIPLGPKPAQANSVEKTVSKCCRRYRVNYVTYCQKHYELRTYLCPIGNGKHLLTANVAQ